MRCDEAAARLDPYIDGELAGEDRAELGRHLALCPHCTAEAAALAGLRDDLRAGASRHPAPPPLAAAIRAGLRAEPRDARAGRGGLSAVAYAATLLLAVALGSAGTLAVLDRRAEAGLADELLDDHLRALLGTHLTDIASSDRHAVKPWFAGRAAVAPSVIDLTGQGFPLLGGRLDLVAGRPAPALVYKRRDHVIDLFVLPASGAASPQALERRGYALRRWRDGDLDYWAVSDVSPGELAELERLLRAEASR